MCLILHGRAHLTVVKLQEQIWPFFDERGAIKFLECYDFVLRSHSPDELKKVYILSPHSTGTDGPFRLEKTDDITFCNWSLQPKTAIGNTTRTTLEFEAEKYEVTRLTPTLSMQRWLRTADQAYAAFAKTGMSLFRVTFDDHEAIKRFNPNAIGDTTYWLRLAFVPQIKHLPREPVPFGPDGRNPSFKTRTCSILSPSLVLARLAKELDQMAEDAEPPGGPHQAKQCVFNDLFFSPASSVRVEDHRITVVTTNDFLMLNSQAEGACNFMGVESVGGDRPATARTWLTGAKYHPSNDPLIMATSVYRYLNEWAFNYKDAKTKEAITAAVSDGNHQNISHVVEALNGVGLVKESGTKKGYYFIPDEAKNSHDAQMLLRFNPASDSELGPKDLLLRNRLYGELPLPDGGGAKSRFVPRGVKIHFDLAFH